MKRKSNKRPGNGQKTARPQLPRAESAGPHREWLSVAVIAVLLVLATLLVYWQVLGYGFILYDDPCYVTDNVYVKAGLTVPGVAWALTTRHYGGWHPLTWLSLMLDSELFGLRPMGFHLVNVLLHIMNALLLFWILRRMTGATWKSGFVAALFALHPLHVESVAWITERKDVLSTLFWLLTMWAYIRYVERARFRRYILVPLLLAIGLTAKPMLVSLPIVLMLLDWWPLRRFVGKDKRRVWGPLIWEKLPLFVLSAASCVVTIIAQRTGIAGLTVIPLTARAENAVIAYAAYIIKAVWPSGLACCYPLSKSLPISQVSAAALFLIAVSLLAFRLRNTHTYFAVGWLWYVITLVPVIGLVQVGAQSMADRYTYVPLIGIFVIFAWGLPDLLRTMGVRGCGSAKEKAPGTEQGDTSGCSYLRTSLLAAAALGVLAALAVSARAQVRYWRDDAALFQRALDVTRGNWVAHDALGTYLGINGDLQGALGHYEAALRICPTSGNTHNNVGFILMQIGKTDDAIRHYGRALSLNPNDPRAHTNMGIALAHEGKLEAAILEYHRALEIDPGLLLARGSLADALVSSGDLRGAVEQYRQVLDWTPRDAGTHCNLAIVLSRLGQSSEAEKELAEAVRLNPGDVQIRTNLALLLAVDGKVQPAMEELQAVLQIQPTFPDAHAALASVYLAQGRYADAWKHIHLCRKYGGSPDPGLLRAIGSRMPDPGR